MEQANELPIQQFDVAFSLLSTDEAVAREIQSQLPPRISSFLYSMRQRELVAQGDGLNAFPAVFRSARVCVVLYRKGWGESRWTRLEESAIGDRFMEEGARFLIFVRLDQSGELPAWVPRHNIWVDYPSEGPKNAGSYILARLEGANTNTYTFATSRKFGRTATPIARYQAQGVRAFASWTPHDPTVCDGCTALVQFRPVFSVGLPEHNGLAPSSEILCPRCARERGIRVSGGRRISDEVLFGPRNPSFEEHVVARLSANLLRALCANEELNSSGVVSVAAGFSGSSIYLLVSREGKAKLRVPLETAELNRTDRRSDADIYSFAISRIQNAIARCTPGELAMSSVVQRTPAPARDVASRGARTSD